MSGFQPGEAGNQFEATGIPEAYTLLSTGTISRAANYLTVPLDVRYQVGRVGISGGGYLGYMTGGSDKLEVSAKQGCLTLEDDQIPDVMNRWDAGLRAQIDFLFRPDEGMRSLRAHLRGSYGLVDTVKDNLGDPITNWGIFLGLGSPVGGADTAEDAARN